MNVKLGLYRAKETRFAGRVRELSRMLRVKDCLQELVFSPEYREWVDKEARAQKKKPLQPLALPPPHKSSTSTSTRDEDEGEVVEREPTEEPNTEDTFHMENGVDSIRKIILDDGGFWKELIDVLQICVPIVQFLRLCDGNRKPAMGKIYDRMFTLQQRLENSSIPWSKDAKELLDHRWEKMHSPMHSAGFVLDPEFLNTEGDHDSHTQEGLLKIIKKIALRDVCSQARDPIAAVHEFTINSPEVQKFAAEVELQLARYQAKDGIFADMSVRLNAKKLTPSLWWRTYGTNLPELRSVASRVLSQPVSSSAAERNWSVYGNIKSKGRYSPSTYRINYHVLVHG